MSATLKDVFADTAFWISLVVKQDQYHDRAVKWSLRIQGRIFTTTAVMLETANGLARPFWRNYAIGLIDHLTQRSEAPFQSDVIMSDLTPELWYRGWELYRNRPDKGWSLTDCISFVVMAGAGLTDALTTDEHYRQAGFRALMLEDPNIPK